MSLLCAKPQRRYPAPAYPTRLQIREDPSLLWKHAPRGWLSQREIAGVLGLALGLQVGGCADSGDNTATSSNVKTLRADQPAVVAPVFEHGEGRAAVGYVGIGNPVAVISEDEALSIIREELGHVGVQFTEQNVAMSEVRIPKRQRDFRRDWVTGERTVAPGADCGPEEPLQADLRDASKQVVVEYLTERDYRQIDLPPETHLYEEYDLAELASRVGRFVQRDGKGAYVGILYDPTATRRIPDNADFGEAMQFSFENRAPLNAESRRLLRLQVRDFIDWLKAQGAI